METNAFSPSGLMFVWSSLQVPVQVYPHPHPFCFLFFLFTSCQVMYDNFISADCSSLFLGSMSGLSITEQPQSQTAAEGDTLLLKCKAEANPPARYEWYHNTVPLPHENTNLLKVSPQICKSCVFFLTPDWI